MRFKTNDEYERYRTGWLNDFHSGGTFSNIFSAKNLLEQSKWSKSDIQSKPFNSSDEKLDEFIDQFMHKGIDSTSPYCEKYSQVAMYLAELKVRRCAAPPTVQPIIVQRDKNGNELNSYENWENAISKVFRELLVMNTLSQDKEDIAKTLQKLKHLCHSMQHWLGFDERQINNFCADLNIKTRAESEGGIK